MVSPVIRARSSGEAMTRSIATSARAEAAAAAWAMPAGERATSVRVVNLPAAFHSVSPWRIRMRRGSSTRPPQNVLVAEPRSGRGAGLAQPLERRTGGRDVARVVAPAAHLGDLGGREARGETGHEPGPAGLGAAGP